MSSDILACRVLTSATSDILACRVLTSANTPEQQKQLARATVGQLTYENMKSKLNKILCDSSASNSENSFQIKIKPTYETQSETDYDTWYGHGYGRGGSNRSRPV